MPDNSRDKDNKQSTANLSLTIFILWVVIKANSSKEQFQILNATDFYNLVELNTYGFLSVFVTVCCTCIITAIALNSEKSFINGLAAIFNVLMILDILIVVIWSLVLLSTIMNNHLQYMIPFYSKFWNTGLMNFTLASQPIIPNSISNITNERQLRGYEYNLQPYNELDYHKEMFNNHESYLMNSSDITNFTFAGNMTLAVMSVFHNYWKNYHNELINFYEDGKFPTHMAAQSKIAISEMNGGIKYNTTVQTKRRRLIDNTIVIDKHWPFIMADILTRISTGGLIIILTIIASFGCCVGTVGGCSKICG